MIVSDFAQAQWTLQTNPLGTGQTAMLGKIQFVSATEGWIACGSNGSLLHTNNGGANWNVVTPFPGDIAGNFSDPASSMSWVNSSSGWALKTLISEAGDIASNANGAVLYGTTTGGSSWTRKSFPKTITTVIYSIADLQGDWQLHALSAKNPSVANSISGWLQGTATVDVNGNCSVSISKSNGLSKSPAIAMNISSRGIVSVDGENIGFMNADKSTIILTGQEDDDAFTIYVLQKQLPGTTYTIADLQGNWQMHGLSSGNTSSQYSGWVHASLTGDNNGNLTGNFIGVGGGGNESIAISITSNGVISGMNTIGTATHGFMSADKKTFYLVMTGKDTNDYNLAVFQKHNPAVTFSVADFQGIWRTNSLISMNTSNSMENNIKTTGFINGKMTLNKQGIGKIEFNNQTESISLSAINPDGIISTPNLNGSTNIHGFMSDDKNTIILTMTDVYGGYEISIVQRDLSISGDIGLQVQFADANTGWVSVYNMLYDNFQIYKTTDGGVNWNPTVGLQNPVGGFYHFVNANEGWLYGSSSTPGENYQNSIFHTTNGGLSWTLQANNIGDAKQIFFSDISNGWVVGKNGLIMHTSNGGAHWSSVTNSGLSANANNKCVFFLDANTGWIGTHADGDEQQYVLSTTNGGASWLTKTVPVNYSVFSIYFTDATNGWLTSDYGQIAQFTNKTGVSNPTDESVVLYPNLSSKGFFLNISENKHSVTIMDIKGSIVIYKQIAGKNYIDISSLSSGLYTVKIQTGNESIIRKLIKK